MTMVPVSLFTELDLEQICELSIASHHTCINNIISNIIHIKNSRLLPVVIFASI